ncbi:MAG: hypothetical protein NZ920_00320 [Aigarchaeota archaeon]|nr:hypothetical protein [Aigarchaeota archaeon]MDW8092747.1 hypothetical protein [Nitrososphaerota archaeon]
MVKAVLNAIALRGKIKVLRWHTTSTTHILSQLLEVSALFALSGLCVSVFGYVVVRWAERLADEFRLDRFVVGFLLLSVVTSVPELTVAVVSGLTEAVEISIGDLLGSSVVNITFVTGLSVFIARSGVTVGARLKVNLTRLLLLSSVIPVTLLLLPIVSPVIGVPLLLTFVFYGLYASRRDFLPLRAHLVSYDSKRWRVVIFIIIGIFGLILSATSLVQNTKLLSELLGIGQLEIGAKTVSLMTSMPEIVTVAASMRRGEYEMAFGNAVGSNFTNMSLILGALLILSGVEVSLSTHYLMVFFVVAVSATFWYFSSRGKIVRSVAALLFIEYFTFLIFSS